LLKLVGNVQNVSSVAASRSTVISQVVTWSVFITRRLPTHDYRSSYGWLGDFTGKRIIVLIAGLTDQSTLIQYQYLKKENCTDFSGPVSTTSKNNLLVLSLHTH